MPLKNHIARISNFMFSPQIAALAAVMVTVVILGCLSLNFGGSDAVHDDHVLAQEGSVNVPPNTQLEVFYPVPFGSTPNLIIDDCNGDCLLAEQKENHFRIFNKNPSKSHAVEWKAKGMRIITVTPDRPPAIETPVDVSASPPVKSPPGPGDTQANVKVGQPK
ncbi:MAG TPA: hypothetical protein VE988_24575 [Gemmataceae bacterium]|nr:hypothetical protein [Gemmataceae bacterium]